MKTKSLKNVLVPVLMALVLALGLTAAFLPGIKTGAAANPETPQLQEEYLVGTEITLPDMTFSVGGSDVKAVKTVYFPDGRTFRADKITPDVMGNYTVEYSADTSEGYKTETKEFYAYKNLYETAGIKSSVSYGFHELTPSHAGLMVSLSGTGTFLYNKVINLSNMTGADKLFSFYVTPEVPGEMDLYTIKVKFTDIYDPESYITMVINASRDGIGHGVAYIQAGANFQPTTGLEANQNKIHRNNIYGFPANFTFYGSDKNGSSSETLLVNNQIEIYFDYASKQILSKTNSQGNNLIIDLDNPEHFADLWSGFSTGEVTMSVSVENMLKSSANLVFTDIAGQQLSLNKLVDDQKPIVTVDNLGYDTMPNAVINKPYPLYTCEAVDQYCGTLEASAKVYENYGSPAEIECDVVDGVFTPSHTGKYYVVYMATDWSGNVGDIVYEIQCVSQSPEIVLTVGQGDTSGYVGTYIELAEAEASGGMGNVKVDVVVTDASGNEVPVENGKFKPLTAGTFTVDYIATDYVMETKTVSYTVQISVSQKPVFDSEPNLPKYIVSGYEYKLPMLYGYDYNDGGRQIAATVTVTDDDGTRTLGADNAVVFKVNEAGGSKDVKIVYSAENSNGSTPLQYTVKAYNVYTDLGRLDMSKYFIGDGIESSATSAAIALTADGSEESVSTEFANTLLAEGFNLIFNVDKNKSAMSKVNIWLTDSMNPAESVKFSFVKTMTTALFRINDGTDYETKSTFSGSVTEFKLSYSNADHKVMADGSNYITVGSTYGGAEFNGFTSGKVYMKIEFEGVTGPASILASTLNLQPLRDTPLDRVSPKVVILGEYGGMYEIGDLAEIPMALVGDVLDPDVEAKVVVRDPSGNFVTATDGTVLNKVAADRKYTIEIKEYGNYRVTFTSTDTAGVSTNPSFVISVDDRSAPVITLSRENASTATLNETVVVASATAEDNYTPAADLVVRQYLVTPSGTVIALTGNSFVANEIGDYTVRYFAVDQAGNFTVLDNVITVTAA